MINKKEKRSQFSPDTISSLKKKNTKLQIQVIHLQQKVLKLEAVKFKLEKQIFALKEKFKKENSIPNISPAQRKILQECVARMFENPIYNKPPKK